MPSYATVDDAPDRKLDRKLLGRTLVYARPYRTWILVAILCNLVVAGLAIVRPILTRYAIDDFILPGKLDGLYLLCGGYFAVLIFQTFMQYGLTYTMAYIGQRIIYDLRVRVFKHALRMDTAYYDRNPVGEMVTRVTNDIDALNEMFSSGIIMIVSDVLLLIAITIAMFWQNWRLALVSFSVLPFLLIISFVFRIKARKAFRAVRRNVGRLNGFMQEHVIGMNTVQLFAKEDRELDRFTDINHDLRSAHIRTIRYYALYFPAIELLSAITIALIIWYGGGQVVQTALKEREVGIGSLVMFIQFVEMFFRPVFNLSDKYNLLQNAMAASERIFNLLDTKPSITSSPDAKSIDIQGEIKFCDVNFEYNDDEPILKKLNLHVPPGETVAIVGATGAGKTTIISLLSRFYDVKEGCIMLDGNDVRSLDLTNLRRQISVVLQDVFLFPGTIRDNIRLDNQSISDDTVQRAATMVGADEFIMRMPKGYDTVLTENGGNLSVGQKQLLSFARAIAHDPRILVLDEATSSVDTQTEHLILQAIATMLEGRTAIVIAHRLSTIRHADRIAVMHHGELRELGTHAELLKKRGIYFKLYQLQYKDQELSDLA